MTNEIELKHGDVVYLKSGSPPMKIEAIYPAESKVICRWINSDLETRRATFLIATVTKTEPS